MQKIFGEALAQGTMEGFFKLISYYQTQSEPAYCGLATLAVVLNALSIDPGRKWKGILLLVLFLFSVHFQFLNCCYQCLALSGIKRVKGKWLFNRPLEMV